MGNKVFEMENEAGVVELVVLAELAPPISPADGLWISTIENLAPEVKQGFGANAFSFALGLYVPGEPRTHSFALAKPVTLWASPANAGALDLANELADSPLSNVRKVV